MIIMALIGISIFIGALTVLTIVLTVAGCICNKVNKGKKKDGDQQQ